MALPIFSTVAPSAFASNRTSELAGSFNLQVRAFADTDLDEVQASINRAFARFEEEGIFNRATGRDFLECVLEQGGTRPAGELFRDFRGREPEIDALLRHSGLAA